MQSLADGGRTVVFVSHNMAAVQSLCSRAVWLDQGAIRAVGSPGEIVPRYLLEGSAQEQRRVWPDPASAPGGEVVRLHQACVRPTQGTPGDAITVRTPMVLEFEYWNRVPDIRLNLTVMLTNSEGTCVLTTFPRQEPVWHGKPFPVGLFRSVVQIPGDLLNNGRYFVELFVVKDETILLDRHEALLSFEVLDSLERRPQWHGRLPGAVHPILDWQTELIAEDR